MVLGSVIINQVDDREKRKQPEKTWRKPQRTRKSAQRKGNMVAQEGKKSDLTP